MVVTVPENPVTLAEAQKLMSEDWRRDITNDFERNGFFSSHITFHSLVNPVTGGSGITHKFTRLTNSAPVEGRLVNQRYSEGKVDTNSETVDVKMFGGTFSLDRFVKEAGTLEAEVYLQMQQLAVSTSHYFDQQCLIGDSNIDPTQFDGILKIAKAYSRITQSEINISNPGTIQTNWRNILQEIDEWLLNFDQRPAFIGGNTRMISCLRTVAREVGVYSTERDQWGHNVATYDGIPLIDFGYRVNQSIDITKRFEFSREPIIKTEADGTSCLVAGRFGKDSIYGICPAIGSILRYWYPNFYDNNVDPVQLGGVEMASAMVVNKLESIGVLSNIQILEKESVSTKKGVPK